MAKNFMSSILDELMGRDRDALPTETPKKINWDDPEMCTFYLVCFCPHELFVNTKADLGPCTKFHDEQMRKKYLEEAPGYKRSIYETEFIRFAEKMISDIEGKIKRGKMRIALANGPDGGTYAGPGSKNAEKIALLTERINQLLEETEAAGCEGDVEKAQGLMKLCDQLKEEREQLKSNEVSHPWNPDKAMQVCEVCGSYLIIGEAQHRLDDHIMGKQHVGFAMLRKNLEEVKNAKDARDQAERDRIQKERERRYGRTSRDREGDKRRDRDRDDRRSRSEHSKSGDKDVDRKGKDRDEKDRRSHRSRSKDKKEKSRDDKDKDKKETSSRDDKDKERKEKSSRDDKDKDRKERSSRDDKDRKERSSRDEKDRRERSSRDEKDKRSHHRSRSSDRKNKDKDKEVEKKDTDKSRDSRRHHDTRDRDRDRDRKNSNKRSRSRSKDRGRDRGHDRDRDRDRHHKRSRSDKEKEVEKQPIAEEEEQWDSVEPPQPEQASTIKKDDSSTSPSLNQEDSTVHEVNGKPEFDDVEMNNSSEGTGMNEIPFPDGFQTAAGHHDEEDHE